MFSKSDALRRILKALEEEDTERAVSFLKKTKDNRASLFLSTISSVDCLTGRELFNKASDYLIPEERQELAYRLDKWFEELLVEKLSGRAPENIPCWLKLYERMYSELLKEREKSSLWVVEGIGIFPSDYVSFWKLPDGKIILNGRYKAVILDENGNPLDIVPEATFLQCGNLTKVLLGGYVIDYNPPRHKILSGLEIGFPYSTNHMTCDDRGTFYIIGRREDFLLLIEMAKGKAPRVFKLPWSLEEYKYVTRTYNGMIASPDGGVVISLIARRNPSRMVKILPEGKVEWEIEISAYYIGGVLIHPVPDENGFLASIGWGSNERSVLTVAEFDWDGKLLRWKSFHIRGDNLGGISINKDGTTGIAGLTSHGMPYVLLLSRDFEQIGSYIIGDQDTSLFYPNYPEPNGIFLDEEGIFIGGKVLNGGEIPLWWVRIPFEGDELLTKPVEFEECDCMPEIKRTVHNPPKPLKRVNADFKQPTMKEIIEGFLAWYRGWEHENPELKSTLERVRDWAIERKEIPTYRTIFGELNFDFSPDGSNPLRFMNLTGEVRIRTVFMRALEKALTMNALYPAEGFVYVPIKAVFFPYQERIEVEIVPDSPSDSVDFPVDVEKLPEAIRISIEKLGIKSDHLVVRLPIKVKSWSDIEPGLRRGG